jgi:predicted transglutaminase-like cysteine proteinase
LFSAPALADADLLSASQLADTSAQTRLTTWQQLLSTAPTLDAAGKLRAVNQLINNSIIYVSDQQT